MKAIIMTIVFVLLCFGANVGAQELKTRIMKVEVDGQEVRDKYKITFYSRGVPVEADLTSDGFVIPPCVAADEYLSFVFVFGRNNLVFNKIHNSKFSEDWIIGIDKKPFSSEFVSPEKARAVKRAYYIQFHGAGLVTQVVVNEKK